MCSDAMCSVRCAGARSLVSIIVMLVLCVTLSIWQQGARTYPINMILLGIITIATGMMLGCVCSCASSSTSSPTSRPAHFTRSLMLS